MEKAAILKNISGFIAAFIALGGWSTINYQKQSDLLEKLTEFEKYKTEENAKLRDKELALDKEKIRLEAITKQIEDTKVQLATAEGQTESKLRLVSEKEQRVAQIAQLVAPMAQKAQEESQIKRLMDEFSSLGVNLQARTPCDNAEALSKFNRALAIMSQISNLSKSAGVYEKYKGFIWSNSRMVHSTDDDCR